MRAVFTMTLLAAGVAVGQPPAKRPVGLEVVPADGFAFVSVNVAKVWDEPTLKGLRDELLKLAGDGAAAFEKEFGVAPADLDRATFLWPVLPTGPRGEAPIVVLSTRKPFNEARVLKALEAQTFADAERRRFGGPAFKGASKEVYPPKGFQPPPPPFPPFPGKEVPPPFPIKKEPAPEQDGCQPRDEPDTSDVPDLFVTRKLRMALYLMDATTVVLLPFGDGDELQMVAMLAKALRKKADGPLSDALAVAHKHTAVAGIDFRPVRRQLTRDDHFPRELVPFRSLVKMDGGFATLDLSVKTGLTATLRFPNADDAERAVPVLKTAIQLAAEELGKEKKHHTREPAAAAVMGPIYDAILAALDQATVKSDGKQVVATATLDLGAPVEKALKGLPEYIRFQSEEMRTLNNLKQLGLALHSYHDVNNTLPQDIVDKTGKPILSWRVQLLPYIEQENMYRQLDLTKPWDDPANARVLATMPKTFETPGRAGKPGETYFQMFTAPKPVMGVSPPLVPGQRLGLTSIHDGTSNTFGVVEAGEGVNWAKPGDLPFDPKKLPALGDPKTGKFRVMMFDGSVRTLRRDKLTDDQLRAAITINGGEVLNLDEK